MDDEKQKDRVKALFQQALRPAERPIKPMKPAPMLGKTVIINGGINHYALAPSPRKVVVGYPPWEVISKAQKAALVVLRDQWVSRHNASHSPQLTRADARKALNDQARVTAHRLIPADRYADLVAWLGSKITSLEARPAVQAVSIHPRSSPQLRDQDP